MKLILKICLYSTIFSSSLVAAKGSPETFFQKYIELGNQFDVNVSLLYSDTAKIHSYRVYPHGLEKTMELKGSQWKQLIEKVMPIAKAQNDKSSFSNIIITKVGLNFKIKADRYSERKCYEDNGYYMIIEPNGNNSFHILEEYTETQPQSNC